MSIRDIFREVSGNVTLKSKIVVLLFRLCFKFYHGGRFSKILGLPFYVVYRILVDVLMGIELNYKTRVGKGLVIYHGVGLVVNTGVVIGENCILRHGVTIGNSILKDGSESQCPVLGNNVEVGASAIILGNIKIGNNVRIGAGALVTKDIPDNSVVVKFNEVRT